MHAADTEQRCFIKVMPFGLFGSFYKKRGLDREREKKTSIRNFIGTILVMVVNGDRK